MTLSWFACDGELGLISPYSSSAHSFGTLTRIGLDCPTITRMISQIVAQVQ